jgi:hypothetical protein
VVVALFPLVALGNLLQPVNDPDTFWHIRAGQYLWSTHQFVGPEPWSRFSSREWVLHEWAPELAYAGAFAAGGLAAVATLHVAAASALFVVVYASCRRFAPALPASLAAIGAWIGASGSIAPRPQLVTFGLLTVVTTAWLLTARDGRARWWIIPVSWVWACSHGLWVSGVVVGVATIVAMVVGHRATLREGARLALVPLLSILAGALTPVGPRLLLTPLEVRGYAQFVAEWEPASLTELPFAVTIAMAVVVAVAWAVRAEKAPLAHVATWAVALGWTLLYSRTGALGAVMLAPLFAGTIASVVSRATEHPVPWGRVEKAALAAGALAATAVAVVLTPHVAAAAGDRFPTGLDRSLAALPGGTTVVNEYALGAWLELEHPDLAPVIDGRTEVFSLAHVRAYGDAVLAHEGWQTFVRQTGATAAVLPVGGPLTGALKEQLGWQEVARDRGYVLLRAAGT